MRLAKATKGKEFANASKSGVKSALGKVPRTSWSSVSEAGVQNMITRAEVIDAEQLYNVRGTFQCLPTGKSVVWMKFILLFIALIHSKERLPNAKKFQWSSITENFQFVEGIRYNDIQIGYRLAI